MVPKAGFDFVHFNTFNDETKFIILIQKFNDFRPQKKWD